LAKTSTTLAIAGGAAVAIVGALIAGGGVRISAPATLTLSASSGIPGETIKISGANLVQVSAVDFNATPATFRSISPTEVSAVVPVGATTGRVHVINLAGTASSGTFTIGIPDLRPPPDLHPAQDMTPPTEQVAVVVSPYSTFSNISASYVYAAAYTIPSDVTSVEVGVASMNLLTSVSPGSFTLSELGVGTPNVGNSNWASAPAQVWSSISVLNTGAITWRGPTSVSRNAGGNVFVAWKFPAGANVGCETGGGASQIYGYVDATGATNVTALSGMTAVNGSSTVLCGNIFLRYNTAKKAVIVGSDSIQRGIQYQGLPSTMITLVGSRDYAMAINGVASSTAAMWASPSYYAWTKYDWFGHHAVLAIGINDVAAGSSASSIIANLTAARNNAMNLGAKDVTMLTITPSASFNGTQNTVRSTVNAAILAKTPGNDNALDADAAIDPTHTNAVPGACGGPIHLNGTCLGTITALVPSF
jgi:hypothetical protein